jgi:glycine cleavage system aminomethyltransferase T
VPCGERRGTVSGMGSAGTISSMIVSDPYLLASIGPRVRKSPLFDATVRAGLTAVSAYNHMWLPMSYGDPAAEYERLVDGVSMWDVAAQRHVEVAGPDADRLVQLVTAVDVGRIDPGRAAWAPMVDHDGTLLNDPVLLHWSDGTWRFSISDSDVGLWITAIGHERRLDVTVRELDTVTIAVQGPTAFEVLDALDLGWADGLDDFERRAGSVDTAVGPVDVVVSRSGWSSQGGVELFVDDPGLAEAVWDTIGAAGAAFGIGPGAPNATERIEHVLLSYGTDTGYDADPIELGIEPHLDLDGPDFIGRDALRRIRDEGPARRLRGAVIDGDAMGVLPHPVPFLVDGDEVGALRAGTHSPRFGRNIGLALVDRRCEPGTEGIVPVLGRERTARLVELPFTESLDG